jgi:hypothetical protein
MLQTMKLVVVAGLVMWSLQLRRVTTQPTRYCRDRDGIVAVHGGGPTPHTVGLRGRVAGCRCGGCGAPPKRRHRRTCCLICAGFICHPYHNFGVTKSNSLPSRYKFPGNRDPLPLGSLRSDNGSSEHCYHRCWGCKSWCGARL